MADVVASLREQAAQCRRLAQSILDQVVSAVLLELADDLEKRAVPLEHSALNDD
jgi:hypothetical protein